jgi:hypothetical protein
MGLLYTTNLLLLGVCGLVATGSSLSQNPILRPFAPNDSLGGRTLVGKEVTAEDDLAG